MKLFEYMMLTTEAKGMFSQGRVDFDAVLNKMNEMGEEGWELVSAMDTNKNQGQTSHVVLYFKRPKRG